MWYYDAMIWLVVVNPSESYVSIDIIIIIGTSSPLLGQKNNIQYFKPPNYSSNIQ